MTDGDTARGQVVSAAAEVYDEFFVPALFGQWTNTLLDAAGVRRGHRVLDVGCGTGVLARAAAERTDAVTGVDRNDGMLAVARARSTTVDWRRAVAEELPFPDSRFDRVLSQFVLMFVDDATAALGEMARVLRPGGRVAAATWSAIEESPGYADMADLLARVVDDDAAAALRAPFTLGTTDAVAELLAPVFPDVEVRRHEGTAAFPSLEDWVHTDIRGWTLADRIDDDAYAAILDEARHCLGRYVDGSGRVSFPAPAIVAAATA